MKTQLTRREFLKLSGAAALSAALAACGVKPTPTPAPTNTPLPTATTLPTATPLPTATATSTPIPTATATPFPTATATQAPTDTPTPSVDERIEQISRMLEYNFPDAATNERVRQAVVKTGQVMAHNMNTPEAITANPHYGEFKAACARNFPGTEQKLDEMMQAFIDHLKKLGPTALMVKSYSDPDIFKQTSKYQYLYDKYFPTWKDSTQRAYYETAMALWMAHYASSHIILSKPYSQESSPYYNSAVFKELMTIQFAQMLFSTQGLRPDSINTPDGFTNFIDRIGAFIDIAVNTQPYFTTPVDLYNKLLSFSTS